MLVNMVTHFGGCVQDFLGRAIALRRCEFWSLRDEKGKSKYLGQEYILITALITRESVEGNDRLLIGTATSGGDGGEV